MKNAVGTVRAFRTQVFILVIALALEFILGMYTSLFIEFPDSLVNGNAWGWSMQASPIILAHIILGSLMVLAGLSMVVLGVIARSQKLILVSVLGFLFLGLAYFSGAKFLADVTNDGFSFLMALGFLGSMLTYGAAYSITRR
jgi:hypothetical protein